MRIEGVDYEVVAEADAQDLGYEWATDALLKDPQGRLYFLSEGGCSCNYFGMDTARSDLVPVDTWQQAAARVAQTGSGYSPQRHEFRESCRDAVRAGRLAR